LSEIYKRIMRETVESWEELELLVCKKLSRYYNGSVLAPEFIIMWCLRQSVVLE
jgi:hypothetical protein